MNDNVNNPLRPIGTYIPEQTPSVGAYTSEISELSNISRSNMFNTMRESLNVDGGAYLSFNRIQDQETFNTNFASNFSSLANSFTATLESQHATSSALDQIREDLQLVQELLDDHIDSANDTPDMFTEIDSFLNTHLNDLSPTAVFKIRSMAVTALEDAYSTVEGAIVHNSYEYLTNLPANDLNTINQFLQNLGLEDVESMTNTPELLDALVNIVIGSGLDGLRDVYRQVRTMFAEQDPEQRPRLQIYRDKIAQLRLLSNTYMSDRTDVNRSAVINLANELNRDYPGPHQIVDIATLLPNTVESIDPATTTPERALGLRGNLSDSINAYTQLNDALNVDPQIAADVQAARQVLENILPDGFDLDQYMAEQEVLLYNGSLPANLFEYLGLRGVTDFNVFRNHVLPSAAPVDLGVHIQTINNTYNTLFTVSDFLDNSGGYNPNTDLGRLIGINGNVSDAILNYDSLYTNLNGDINPTLMDAQITRLNCSFVNDNRNLSRELLVNSETRQQNNLPGNLFQLLNLRGINSEPDLLAALGVHGRNIDTYIADLSNNHGINFERDAIVQTNQADVNFGLLDGLRDNIPDHLFRDTVNITSDQAAIALMGLTNNVHARNLNEPVILSPEASLKSGVISFVSNRVRREMQNIRQQYQTQDLNLERIAAAQGPDAAEAMESQFYLLDYKEAMLSLALDLSIMSPSVNTSLKNNLEILADDFSIEDFESTATNMTDQQLLMVSAELNSFAEGTRRSTKHDNKRIMFRSNHDIAMVKKFTSCAIEFIQKRTTTNMLKDINLQASNVSRPAKLRQLAVVAHSRMSRLASTVDRAFLGSKKPANYRFMLGVKQELDSLSKELRGYETPWSLNRSFTSGYDAHTSLQEEISKRGLSEMTQKGDLVKKTKFLINTTVSDLITSPIWLTRKGFKPSINKITNATNATWKAAKWSVSTPFNLSKKALDATFYSAGWLAGAPIRIPVNIVKGIWSGAVGA